MLLQMLPARSNRSRRAHPTMTGLLILERTMKTHLPLGLIMLTLGLAHAGPGDQRTHPMPSNASVMVMPISVDEGEPRNVMRLRDVLKQPFDDMEDNAKPYRLSVEERQRLREQLRGQSPHEHRFKP
ncbi:hypothetical protein [Hydrogenophaga sp. PBL-H3]|uniref:hypothetical protein n=2 Tax=Hydrogenophaga sp. PBL-H3 TaxID=434010 RepID=UPI001F416226|nr:hypothetical protein [Hydrogenophaga sp. PBL-H3]